MDKHYYSPLAMIKIATQHAYSAEHLLHNTLEEDENNELELQDSLLSIVSLMYIAFEMTLRAYLLQNARPIKPPKNLAELVELNRELVFSQQETRLLKRLSHQSGFRRGFYYESWDSREQFLIFCNDIVEFYERLQNMMPLELQRDYQM